MILLQVDLVKKKHSEITHFFLQLNLQQPLEQIKEIPVVFNQQRKLIRQIGAGRLPAETKERI